MNARDLLNKMAEAEESFLQSTFVAPVRKGVRVRVRVAGIVWEFAVEPRDFEGWAVLQAVDHGRARVIDAPKLGQIREYLTLFPLVPLILCERRKDEWWAIPANASDGRLRIEGPVPVTMAQDVQLFDHVRTRWDGARFLFE